MGPKITAKETLIDKSNLSALYSYEGPKGTTYKVRIRKKDQSTGKLLNAAKSFKKITDAKRYRTLVEAQMIQGTLLTNKKGHLSLSDLINEYIEAVGHNFRRSKTGAYKLIQNSSIGKKRIDSLQTEDLIKHGQIRQKPKTQTLKDGTVKQLPGAGGSTLQAEFSYIGVVLKWAKSNNYAVNENLVKDSRRALELNHIIGDGMIRTRRPTQEEIDRLINYFEVTQPKRDIPLGTLIRFAIGTGFRLGEICGLKWADLNEQTKTIFVRDRKDPRMKKGKDDEASLIWQTGYDTFEIVMAQKGKHPELIFPYSGDTVSSVFPRACARLGIKDLRFHDFRHHFCSLMIEEGWSIPMVRVNSGHRNLTSMQRYMNIQPSKLHKEKPVGWVGLG